MPCADLHTEVDGMAISIDTTHEHQEEHQDLCPPFCSCNCCSSSEVNSLPDDFSEKGLNTLLTTVHYQSEYYVNHDSGIWQPPKFS